MLSQITRRLHKVRVCPTGFRATFAAVFVSIDLLREFPLSAVGNRFEMRCPLKQAILLQNMSLFFKTSINEIMQLDWVALRGRLCGVGSCFPNSPDRFCFSPCYPKVCLSVLLPMVSFSWCIVE